MAIVKIPIAMMRSRWSELRLACRTIAHRGTAGSSCGAGSHCAAVARRDIAGAFVATIARACALDSATLPPAPASATWPCTYLYVKTIAPRRSVLASRKLIGQLPV